MENALKWFEDQKFVAVVRSSSADDAEEMIKAAAAGGFRLFEISMQTPHAIRLIENHSKREGFFVGAGSVTDGEMAQRAINAGAKFLASLYTDRDVINVAKNNDSFVIQGAVTPTEVFNAYQFGADLIKIYPAGFAGGPSYIKTLRTCFPFLKFIGHGDISLENAGEYLKHCAAVSIGTALFEKSLLRSDNWNEITERARQFTQKLETLKVVR